MIDILVCFINPCDTRLFLFCKMSEFTTLVAAPARKRTTPTKVDPKQKRLRSIQTIKPVLKKPADSTVAAISTTQVLEEGESSKVWQEQLNDLFKSLEEKPDGVNKKKYCPLHLGVLKKKMSRKGWVYTRCDTKNCPIWLAWDDYLDPILLDMQYKMHVKLRQGLFFCYCRQPCKIGMTKNPSSTNYKRCYLTCAQQRADNGGCPMFQWIDEDWSVANEMLQEELRQEMFEQQANVTAKV